MGHPSSGFGHLITPGRDNQLNSSLQPSLGAVIELHRERHPVVMKIEDLAYQVARETLLLLEKRFHYRVTEEHKREIQEEVRANLNAIMARSKDVPRK